MKEFQLLDNRLVIINFSLFMTHKKIRRKLIIEDAFQRGSFVMRKVMTKDEFHLDLE